jgi:transposase-like protein
MKANIKLISKQRKFSEDFKKSIVHEFECGKFSVLQLERLHNISNSLIYNWIYKYSTSNEKGQRIVEMKDSSTQKLKALEQKIKDLERTVGQKQIMIDYLEKMIDIANEELKVDIKKNLNTPQSNGSAPTQKK